MAIRKTEKSRGMKHKHWLCYPNSQYRGVLYGYVVSYTPGVIICFVCTGFRYDSLWLGMLPVPPASSSTAGVVNRKTKFVFFRSFSVLPDRKICRLICQKTTKRRPNFRRKNEKPTEPFLVFGSPLLSTADRVLPALVGTFTTADR